MASVNFLIFFFVWGIGKLHSWLVEFEPMTSPSIPLLWKEEVTWAHWQDVIRKLMGFNQFVFVSEQAWNAFEDSIGNLPLDANMKGSELQIQTHNLSSTAGQYLGDRDLEVCVFSSNICPNVYLLEFILKQYDLQDSSKDGIQRVAAHGGPPGPTMPPDVVVGPSYTPMLPPMVCTL